MASGGQWNVITGYFSSNSQRIDRHMLYMQILVIKDYLPGGVSM